MTGSVELRGQSAAKRKRSAKILGGDVGFSLPAQADSKLPGMPPAGQRGIVLQLEVILIVQAAPGLRAAIVERSQHQQRRTGVVGGGPETVAEILEARFVDRSRVEHRGLGG